MALVECEACKGQVSGDAKACPACGHPVPHPASFVPWLVIVSLLLIGVAVAAGWAAMKPGKPTRADICAGKVTVTVEMLVDLGLSYTPEIAIDDAARKAGLPGPHMLTFGERQTVLKGLARCEELQ